MPTRVLLVEDDILARRNIASYLRRSQLEVDEAADGEEAVRLITSITNTMLSYPTYVCPE